MTIKKLFNAYILQNVQLITNPEPYTYFISITEQSNTCGLLSRYLMSEGYVLRVNTDKGLRQLRRAKECITLDLCVDITNTDLSQFSATTMMKTFAQRLCNVPNLQARLADEDGQLYTPDEANKVIRCCGVFVKYYTHNSKRIYLMLQDVINTMYNGLLECWLDSRYRNAAYIDRYGYEHVYSDNAESTRRALLHCSSIPRALYERLDVNIDSTTFQRDGEFWSGKLTYTDAKPIPILNPWTKPLQISQETRREMKPTLTMEDYLADELHERTRMLRDLLYFRNQSKRLTETKPRK